MSQYSAFLSFDETINETGAQWKAQTRDEHGFVEVNHLAEFWIGQMLR